MSAALLPSSATAQSLVEARGSLGLVQAYDDNLFYRPSDREEDFISRLGARLGAGYRSATLRVMAHGRLDAEVYRQHPELNTAAAYHETVLELDWAPSKRLAARAGVSYTEAQDPGQLNIITGLETGRFRGRRLSTEASLSRRLGPLTTATVEHNFTSEQFAQEPVTDIQTATLGLKRRFGPVDEGRLRYGARRFASGRDVTLSHVVTLGWSRDVTPAVHFEFDAGPRLSGQTVAAEVSARLRYRSPRGEAALEYLRTQTTVLGQPGPVTADGVTATFSRLLRSLRVGVGPSVFRVGVAGAHVTVQRLNLEIGWRVSRQLSLVASHQFTFQRGEPGLVPAAGAEVTRNRFSFGVAAGSTAH